jgi:hypothetical protein
VPGVATSLKLSKMASWEADKRSAPPAQDTNPLNPPFDKFFLELDADKT